MQIGLHFLSLWQTRLLSLLGRVAVLMGWLLGKEWLESSEYWPFCLVMYFGPSSITINH